MRGERSLPVLALAIFCIFLVAGAQPVQAVAPIVIAAGIVASFLAGIFLGYIFSAPSWQGVPASEYTQTLYSGFDNAMEKISAMAFNTAELYEDTVYLQMRRAEAASVNFVNTGDISLATKMKILKASGALDEAAGVWYGVAGSVANEIARLVSIAKNVSSLGIYIWTGSDQNNLRDWLYDYASENALKERIAMCTIDSAMNPSKTIWFYMYAPGSITVRVESPSTPYIYNENGTAIAELVNYNFDTENLSPGIYYIQNVRALVVPVTSGMILDSNDLTPFLTIDYSIYNNMDLITRPTIIFQYSSTYYICEMPDLSYVNQKIWQVLSAAASAGIAYKEYLRGLGYTDPSQIPPQYIIPYPDVALLPNEDVLNLSWQEKLALYIAWCRGAAAFFNSTTYRQANWTGFLSNVTFNNAAVLVNATFYRGDEPYAGPGLIYLMTIGNITVRVGQNYTFTTQGYAYEVANKTLFTYMPGDIMTVHEVLVRQNDGSYTPTTNEVTIKVVYASQAAAQSTATASQGGTSNNDTGLLDRALSTIKKYKWFFAGFATFILLIIYAPVLNKMGRQWVRAWR